jgi:uncharacterized repeat protein (TIGR04076 family)
LGCNLTVNFEILCVLCALAVSLQETTASRTGGYDMNRREFLEKSGCGMTVFAVAPAANGLQGQQTSVQPAPAQRPPRYKIEVEIFEARTDTWCHKKGDKFEYPKDMARICPWLRCSMHDFIVVLQSGGTLPWKYEGTPYQKVIDPDGITTEFVRCPDPTSNLVAKITRTKIG